MPTYFNMTLQFEKNRLKPDFVKELYFKIISCGFEFKSGYWVHENASLDEIIAWNQDLLEKGFNLGFTQHVKHDYMQILFKSEAYSELRGFWMYRDSSIDFNLIIPEYDILNRMGGEAFTQSKVTPVKELAKEIWESGIPDAIQTCVECDYGYYSINQIYSGVNISINPFAILKKDVHKKFPKGFFCDKTASLLGNNGILLESDGTVPHYVL